MPFCGRSSAQTLAAARTAEHNFDKSCERAGAIAVGF